MSASPPADTRTGAHGRGRTRPLALALLVFLAALAMRLLYDAQLGATPFAKVLLVDEEAYQERALAIAGGDLLGPPRPFYQDPLYPYLLAALYRVAGPEPATTRLVQAGLGALAAALAALAAAELWGLAAGLVAGLLLALCKGLLFYDAQVEKTSVAVALGGVLAFLAVRARASSRRSAWLLAAGLTAGLLSLLRGNVLLILPLAVVWLWLRPGRQGSGKAAVAFALGALAAILPVTARNLAIGGELVLTTAQAGQNFYIGNWSGNHTGSYVAPPFVRAHPRFEELDFRLEAERRLGRPAGAVETSRMFGRLGLLAVRSDPQRFLRLCGLRLLWSLHAEDVPDNHDARFLAGLVPLLRAPLPGFGWLVVLGLAGLAGGAVVGHVGARPLLALVFLYVISLLPFFVVGRYRVVLAAPLALGAGLLARLVEDGVRQRRVLVLLPAVLLPVVVLALLLSAFPEVPRSPAAGFLHLGHAYEEEGEPGLAEAAYARAVAAEPGNAIALFNQASLVCARGERERAERLFRRSIASWPGFAQAHAGLGTCLLEKGGDVVEAETELLRASEIDPTDPAIAHNLAVARRRRLGPAHSP